jgi:hypothetical protein
VPKGSSKIGPLQFYMDEKLQKNSVDFVWANKNADVHNAQVETYLARNDCFSMAIYNDWPMW